MVNVCPGQKLMSVTYPLANPSLRTLHQGMLIEHTGVTTYTVTVEQEFRCESHIVIIAEDREIESKIVAFSKSTILSYLYHTILS